MIVAEALARDAPDLFDRFDIEYGRAEALFRFFEMDREPHFRIETNEAPAALDASAAAKVLISFPKVELQQVLMIVCDQWARPPGARCRSGRNP
ncbi:MAG: hypothetical protein EOR30_33220, partial [Mesorhizobium sp.]